MNRVKEKSVLDIYVYTGPDDQIHGFSPAVPHAGYSVVRRLRSPVILFAEVPITE